MRSSRYLHGSNSVHVNTMSDSQELYSPISNAAGFGFPGIIGGQRGSQFISRNASLGQLSQSHIDLQLQHHEGGITTAAGRGVGVTLGKKRFYLAKKIDKNYINEQNNNPSGSGAHDGQQSTDSLKFLPSVKHANSYLNNTNSNSNNNNNFNSGSDTMKQLVIPRLSLEKLHSHEDNNIVVSARLPKINLGSATTDDKHSEQYSNSKEQGIVSFSEPDEGYAASARQGSYLSSQRENSSKNNNNILHTESSPVPAKLTKNISTLSQTKLPVDLENSIFNSQLLDFEGNGKSVRYDASSGKVLGRSVAGKPEWFMKKENALSDISRSKLREMSEYSKGRLLLRENSISTSSIKKHSDKDRQRKKLTVNRVMKSQLLDSISQIEERIEKNRQIEKDAIDQLPISLHILATRDKRIFSQHDRNELSWQRFIEQSSNALHRDFGYCTLVRQDQYRGLREATEVLNACKSDLEKLGPKAWELNLRRSDGSDMTKKSHSNIKGSSTDRHGINQKDLESLYQQILEKEQNSQRPPFFGANNIPYGNGHFELPISKRKNLEIVRRPFITDPVAMLTHNMNVNQNGSSINHNNNNTLGSSSPRNNNNTSSNNYTNYQNQTESGYNGTIGSFNGSISHSNHARLLQLQALSQAIPKLEGFMVSKNNQDTQSLITNNNTILNELSSQKEQQQQFEQSGFDSAILHELEHNNTNIVPSNQDQFNFNGISEVNSKDITSHIEYQNQGQEKQYQDSPANRQSKLISQRSLVQNTTLGFINNTLGSSAESNYQANITNLPSDRSSNQVNNASLISASTLRQPFSTFRSHQYYQQKITEMQSVVSDLKPFYSLSIQYPGLAVVGQSQLEREKEVVLKSKDSELFTKLPVDQNPVDLAKKESSLF